MSKHELKDKDGKGYVLKAGPGPKWPDRTSLASCSISAGMLLERFCYTQLNEAMFTVSGHLANQAALCQPCSPPHFSNSGIRSIAACPKQAINDGLASNNLVIHKLGTTEVEEVQTDNRSLLKVKIRQALKNIVSDEKAEAKMHQNLMQQESAGNKALIYTGAFLTGLWNAGSDLAVWLKEVNDVVNPAFRLMRSVRTNVKVASRVSASSENIAAVYVDEHLKAEKKELVEVLGFDPSSITSEQFDKTMEICELIWEDPDMQPMLWQFCKDYVGAQHAVELTSMSGEGAFEVLLTAILAAVTLGAGLALAAGAQARHLRKFQKVGVLLKEFGEALRDLKIREKARGVKANKASNSSLYTGGDEIAVAPVTRKVENKPTQKAEKKDKKENKPPTNKYPTSLAEAKERLAVSRANLTESGKYEPKYSQAELEAQVAQGTLDERFVVTLQKKKSDDLPVGFKRDSGRTTTWTTTFDQMEKADTDPKLLNDLNGMKWDPDAEWEVVVIDQGEYYKGNSGQTFIPTYENTSKLGQSELSKKYSQETLEKVMTPEYSKEYSEKMSEFKAEGRNPYDRDQVKSFGKDKYDNKNEYDEFMARHEYTLEVGTNEHFSGDGLTKTTGESGYVNKGQHGTLETITFEKSPESMAELEERGAIIRIPAKPIK